ncbi:sigma-54 dependent transcriptional regulator [Motiliproteus sp. SC1-56]|uniref:sigma-54-dependent transcriptional regulator n=1 Tax=Motiliproteus sp. SC1-56 TaxID=2799565 RepID=UPI001F5C89A6|nr:sigma-54 dependent transcriptional regulator [Motiliproteus sp. SC1-56]
MPLNTGERPCVLLVDDEARSLETMNRTLDEEFDVLCAGSVDEAERLLTEHPVQVILCDQRMPGVTGVEFLTRVRARWPQVWRIIISGYTDAEGIIQGINEGGIYQYITKPWHPDELLMTVRNAAQLYRLQNESGLLSTEMKVTAPSVRKQLKRKRSVLKENFQLERIRRTETSPLNEACAQLSRIAPYDISLLITGESGTGKELFARALHYSSARSEKPFVSENCGAMHDELLSSELFGHRKGAFTGAISDHVGLFEQAHGGTIFLDEIGEISPAFQVKLLRVLQEGEIRPLGSDQKRRVDVRVVAATNRDLQEEVRAGRFRQDLYYRLAQVTLELPPLRERPMDIPSLAETILHQAVETFGKSVEGFTEEALSCLCEYDWPGNVRELQNEVQRMLVFSREPLLGAELISSHIIRGVSCAAQGADAREWESIAGLRGTLKERVELLEASILREALIRHRWNKSHAAEELGLSRVGLRNKLERYGLEKNGQDAAAKGKRGG